MSKVKDKLENKLFYDEFIYGKNNLIALAEKNSLVAAKLYQLMLNEINEGTRGISNFIYDNIIESPYLLSDKIEIWAFMDMIILLNLKKTTNI